MNTTLNDFISAVKEGGMANANRFYVEITKKSLDGSTSEVNRKVGLFCDAATIPGIQILSTPARTFGEIREVPYEITYDPVNLSFYVDNKWEVKTFFESWRTEIFNPITRTGQYYNKFVKDVRIYCYNKENNKTFTVNLINAYPKTIGAIPLDSGNKDVPKLPITLQYEYYEMEDTVSGSPTSQKKYGNTGNVAGIPGGFGGDIDFGNIFGGYFQSSGSVGVPSQYLSSFGGFQNTLNSFSSGNSFSNFRSFLV